MTEHKPIECKRQLAAILKHHMTFIMHEYKMDDDDEIQVVEVRVFRPSLTVIVSSYINVEL